MARVVGRRAARTAAGSPASTKLTSMPKRGAVWASSEWVPPYRSRWATTWSPAPASDSSTVAMAPMPEAVARPSAAPSRSATVASRAAVVGFS